MGSSSHEPPSVDDVAALRASLVGGLMQQGDDCYDAARVVWNGMIDRRPACIARCTGTADVIESVSFARRHGLELSVRGGGHNVAGYAVCEGGLMIDLSAMRAVSVDPAKRRAWVQGGALWADVDRETTAFGLAAPGGLVSQTGVAGLTLSGGIGWLRGRHGLSIDNLEAVDIVTADGRLLHADAREHPDLFWAVPGGGGNFGVVTWFICSVARCNAFPRRQRRSVTARRPTCSALMPSGRSRPMMPPTSTGRPPPGLTCGGTAPAGCI
jgi:FAD/FMN-containing dehydrogenase